MILSYDHFQVQMIKLWSYIIPVDVRLEESKNVKDHKDQSAKAFFGLIFVKGTMVILNLLNYHQFSG